VQVLGRPIRFLSILAFVLSAALLGNAGTAAAAGNPLLCFDGTTDGGFNGTCTLIAAGAILNTFDGDTNPNNAYAGVYYAQSSLSGKALATVSASFTYAASAGTTASGGSPRISIPIDTNGDGTTTENYAFVDTLGCNDGSVNNGTLSLSDLTCTVAYGGGGSWVNWAAFAAANPTWRVSNSLPFVIVDQPGLWTVTNVQLGQGEATNVATKKDECKKGGWADMTRADGSSFKNQGDCIQYVNTGK
jgi:hypothetical protein